MRNPASPAVLVFSLLLLAPSPAWPRIEFGGNPLGSPNPVPTSGAAFLPNTPGGVTIITADLDAGDTDVFSFELDSGDLLLSAVFTDDAGEFDDTLLGVFVGASGTPEATNDDGGAGRLSRHGEPVDQTTFWKVAVTGFGDDAFDGSHAEATAGPIPYRLVVAVASEPPLREESDLSPGPQGSNDTRATADPLPVGGATTRGSLVPGDVDYFSIDLEVGDVVTASVFDLTLAPFSVIGGERNDTLLGLLRPDGSAALTNDDGGLLFLSNLSYTVPPGQAGTWNLAVTTFEDTGFSGNHAEASFDYELVVATVKACPNPVQVITQLVQPSIPPGAPPPGQLMGDSYQLASLGDGGRYYTDRFNPSSHFIVDVPADLECAEWILTRNDDKAVTEATGFLDFTLGEAAIVHVGYDDRATAEPAWLTNDYIPLSLTVDIEEGGSQTGFDAWRAIFPAGPVSMGGNRASPGNSSAGSNYVVLVTLPDPDGVQRFFGVAEGGGTVTVEIGGEVIVVPTSPGDTPADVAAALAAAINANSNLEAQGIIAIADGGELVTSGTIDAVAITDAGIATMPPIPALRGVPRFGLWVLLLLAASAAGRGIRSRAAC